MLDNEKIRYRFFEKQQIGLMLNIINREYKREELEKKLEQQSQLQLERELEIKKMREKEKIEHDERDRLQALKMEKRAEIIKNELLKKAKEREEVDKKLMIKNELRKLAEEREKEERQRAIKLKEQIFRKRIEFLYSLRLKKREKIEKEILKKEEIQKKNLEELRIKKDKEYKERIKSTDEKIKRAIRIIKIRDTQKDEQNRRYYIKKTEIIRKKLELQKEQEKSLLRERLIHSAIKREEVQQNLKHREEQFKRNRLRLIYEINEKDKRIHLAKSQKLKILQEQKRLTQNFEESREKLILKFKSIMDKRRQKSQEQVISELLKDNKDIKGINSYKNFTPIYERNPSKSIDNKNKKNNSNIFLTNLSMRLNDDIKYKI
jgi:hypothetical protein